MNTCKNNRYRKGTWDINYNLLIEYKNEYGDVDVPYNYKVNGVNLGIWVSLQRCLYNSGAGKISQEHIDKLNELGMKWSINGRVWDYHYALVKKYYLRNGNVDIPANYIDEEDGTVDLNGWLIFQRQTYKCDKLKIKDNKIILLNEVEIDWNTKDTKLLNKSITNIELYSSVLNKRVGYILRDLALEGIDEINSFEEQKIIEKKIVKRIWR